MIVFSYSFPHKKSQDFILLINALGYKIEAVIASRPRRLNLPAKKYRYKPEHTGLVEIPEICKNLRISYHEFADHNSKECADLLADLKCDVGIIAGARILKRSVIDVFSKGIVNFHPGIIPHARGLDSMLWSIYLGLPIGITAHFIDERIDAGRVLMKEFVKIRQDDTMIDLSLRMYETQLLLLPRVLKSIMDDNVKTECVSYEDSGYRKSFPYELEDDLLKKFEQRKMVTM